MVDHGPGSCADSTFAIGMWIILLVVTEITRDVGTYPEFDELTLPLALG